MRVTRRRSATSAGWICIGVVCGEAGAQHNRAARDRNDRISPQTHACALGVGNSYACGSRRCDMQLRLKILMWMVTILAPMSGCQMPARRIAGAAPTGDAAVRLDAALAGDYDNDEQVRQSRVGVRTGSQVAVPHLREQWRLLEHDRDHGLWLWHWQSQDPPAIATADWLYRVAAASDAGHVVLTPYRAIDPAAVN